MKNLIKKKDTQTESNPVGWKQATKYYLLWNLRLWNLLDMKRESGLETRNGLGATNEDTSAQDKGKHRLWLCPKSLPNHYVVHYIVTTPFCSGVRMFSVHYIVHWMYPTIHREM